MASDRRRSEAAAPVKRDYRKWESPALGRDMELLVFGEHGSPVVVFPTSMGRFYQWEDFGMVAHLARRIEDGLLQLWCVDTVDGQSFYNKHIEPQERARRHVSYDRYLMDEVLPAIRRENNDPRLELHISANDFPDRVCAPHTLMAVPFTPSPSRPATRGPRAGSSGSPAPTTPRAGSMASVRTTPIS